MTAATAESPDACTAGPKAEPLVRSFATTREQRVRELRREAAQRALGWICAGAPEDALRVMTECLATQARLSGIRAD